MLFKKYENCLCCMQRASGSERERERAHSEMTPLKLKQRNLNSPLPNNKFHITADAVSLIL